MSETKSVTEDPPKAVPLEAAKAELNPDNTKICSYCGSEIPRKAYVCPTCKYYQAQWRNSLIMLGGLTGLLALLLSSASFIWNNAIEIIAKSSWEKNVNIHYLRTSMSPLSHGFTAVFSNSGVDPVYISEIVAYWRGRNSTLRVDKPIPPRNFVSISTDVIPEPVKYYPFIATKNGIPSIDVIKKNSTLDGQHLLDGGMCVLEVYYTMDASDIQRMRKFYALDGRVLVSEPIEAHLIYFRSTTGEKIDSTFPAVVAFAQFTSPTCQRINIE